MNEQIKKYASIAIVVAIFLFAYAALSYVRTYSKSIEPSTFRSFSVSGEGKLTAIPDIAQFSFSVVTEGGKDIAKLQSENTQKTNKIIEFLKSSGIESKDIKTASYNLAPRYQYFSCPPPRAFETAKPCPPPEIVGYTINQSVEVKIRDFAKIGNILAGVVERGANTVSQLQFTIDDPIKLQNEAREKAINQAKEKAKIIAKAGEFRIGRLLSIDEGGFFPPVFFKGEALGVGGDMPTPLPSPTIEPGSQDITVTVNLRYEIE